MLFGFWLLCFEFWFYNSAFWIKLVNSCIVWKGSIHSDDAKAYAIWFTSPNQQWTSVIVHGLGKCLIAPRTLGHGRTVVSDISNPEKGTVSLAIANFDEWRIIPFQPEVSRNLSSWKKLLSMEWDHIGVPSITFVLFLTSLMISSNRLVERLQMRYGLGANRVPVQGVMNVVRCWSWGFRAILWYPF